MEVSNMENHYNIEEIKFIKEFYPIFGAKYCSNYLNRDVRSIRNFAFRIKLKNIKYLHRKYEKPAEFRKVNQNGFINVETKYHAYILGLLWGDGCIRNGTNTIFCGNILKDAKYLIPIFNNTGKWNIKTYHNKKKNEQPFTRFTTSNKPLYDFLFSLDYYNKSCASHEKIIEYIPNHFKNYWLRGYIDADGCFTTSINKNKSINRSFSLTSTTEQKWNYLINFFKNINIPCRIEYRKKGGSTLKITKRTSFLILNKYLYSENWDNIGLKRKYDKLQEILNSYK